MNLGGKNALNEKYLSSIKQLKQKFNPFQISDHICFQKDNGVYFPQLKDGPVIGSEVEISIISEAKRKDD